MTVDLCECGCGEATSARYVNAGHATRKSALSYVEENRGYETPCWIWQRAIGKLGYGNTWTGGTTRNAHRVYYERANGPIPAGMQLDHLCRNRACVNPEHLEPVTNLENSHRGSRRKLSWEDVRAIRASAKTHREIAAEFGVGKEYVWKIRNGHRRALA